MREFRVPSHACALPLEGTRLSLRTRNALRRNGIALIGDLHGRSVTEVAALDRVGPSAVLEVLQYLQRLERIPPEAPPAEPMPQQEVPSGSDAAEPFVIPDDLKTWPIECVSGPCTAITISRLKRAGLTTVGSLSGLTAEGLLHFEGVGVTAVRQVGAALDLLVHQLPDLHVLKEDASGHPLPPRMSLAVFKAVAEAESPSAEYEALFTGLSNRNKELIETRWRRVDGRPTILESIAEEHGLTRERVRQITQKFDDLLQTSNLKLPRLSECVGILDLHGGALEERKFVQALQTGGISIDGELLLRLAALSELGLVPRIVYNPEYDLWLSEACDALLDSGKLAADAAERRASIRKSLRRNSYVRQSLIGDRTSSLRLAERIVAQLGREVRHLTDCLVPYPTLDSSLTRAIERMLVVTPSLRLGEIAAGLQRVTLRRAKGEVEALDVPPLEVLNVLIAGHQRMTVNDGRVARVGSNAEGLLTPAEKAVVAAITRNGGIASWHEVVSAVRSAGYSLPTAAVVLKQPFIARRGTGLYGLRGYSAAPEVVTAAIRARRSARRRSVRSVSYNGGAVAKIVYELTAFSIQGVLPVPSKLKFLAKTTWTGRVPSGREFQLRKRNMFIWSIQRWIAEEGLQVGDLIVATLYIADSRIEFETLT